MSNLLTPKLVAEFIGAFALVFIGAGAASIVAEAAGFGGISAVAFAHGLTMMVFIIMGGALTGAAFNPARALGPMIVTGNLGNAWLYVLAPIVGAIIAAAVY